MSNKKNETALVPLSTTEANALVEKMTDVNALLMPATEEDLYRMMNEADYVAPKFIKIQPGTMMTDVRYDGISTMQLVADARTGEVKDVKCHHFSKGKMSAWTIGAHELDRGLEKVPCDGSMLVTIFRGVDRNIPGTPRRVSQYQVTARRDPKFRPAKAALPPAEPAQ